jgi:hypothetical protein
MRLEDVLKEGIAGVGVIFLAFSGFLTNIAPPSDSKAAFPVGIASFILLFVFLLIRFTLHYRWPKRKKMKIWLSASVIAFFIFLGSSTLYYLQFQKKTFKHLYGQPLFVKGSELTGKASEVAVILKKQEGGVLTDGRLVSAFGDPRGNASVLEEVWTKESLEHSRLTLNLLYILVVLSIGLAILALTALW